MFPFMLCFVGSYFFFHWGGFRFGQIFFPCIFWDDHNFSLFSLLGLWIIRVYFWILNQPHIPGINFTWPPYTFSFYIDGFDFLSFYLDILLASKLIQAPGLFLCFQCLVLLSGQSMNFRGMSSEIFHSLQFSKEFCVELLLFIP